MFVGFFLRSIMNELLDEGDINERDFDIFYKSVLDFHRAAFICAMNNFPLQDESLQHIHFVNFYNKNAPYKVFLLFCEVEVVH